MAVNRPAYGSENTQKNLALKANKSSAVNSEKRLKVFTQKPAKRLPKTPD